MDTVRASQSRLLRSKLDDTDVVLRTVVRERVVKPGSDVLRQGEVPIIAHVLLGGHTYHYRMLSDGRRQITAVLVPGDICDLEAVMRARADYSVGALTHCLLGEIPLDKIADPTTLDPEMTRALWRRLLRDQAVAREWLVNLGCRTALERVAYLICEFHLRLKAVGLTEDDAFKMEMTQTEIADLLGLSVVHVNRTLKRLRSTGLIDYSKSIMSILNVPVLEKMAGFDPTYLKII